MISSLDAAHGYAKRGWRVVPLHHVGDDDACSCKAGAACTSAGKHPIERRWGEAARFSGADIEAAWEMYPQANVGLATGPRSGFWVLDVDPKNGGDTALDELLREHGSLPISHSVRSGSGGTHFYFALPDFPVSNSAGRLPSGIDVRGDGGQVVAPPSRTPHGRYAIIASDPAGLVQAPGWLLDLIRPRGAVLPEVFPGDVPDMAELPLAEQRRLASYTKTTVARELAGLPREGQAGWDLGVFRVACNLIELANSPWCPLTHEAAWAALLAAAPQDAGFGPDRIEAKWRSATRRIAGRCRDLPEPPGPPAGIVFQPKPPGGARAAQNGSGSVQGATATVTDLATRERPVEAVVEASLPRSDDGNALLLVERFGDRIRYCPERGAWLAWAADEARWDWCEAGGGVIREYGKRVARALPSTGDGAVAHKTRSLGAGGTSAMLLQASTDSRVVVRLADLDADPYALNTPGGVVDLRTGLLAPSDAAGMHTRSTSVAPDFAMPTPRWDTFLADTFAGHGELTGYVQRLAGYSATGLVIHHVLPFAYGAGQNGKTILLEVLRSVLGTYGGTVPAGFLMARINPAHETEIARLSGLRFVICSEVNQSDKFDEARVKLLTGGDRIAARFMRGDYFEFQPTHHLWLMGNHQPKVGAGGDSFWRRLRMVAFANRVPDEKKIDGLDRLLVEGEGPGILAWIVRGAAEALRDGLRTPPSVMAATEVYAHEEDTLARFMADRVRLGGGEHVRVNTAVMRRAYEDWCRGEGEPPMQATPFGRELKARYGVESSRSNGKRFYLGMTLLGDSDERDGLSLDLALAPDPRGDGLWFR